ncbi:PHP domain-containing protein [Dehalococcoidia bacterium]|nr:PHP domain-containing protein [Dehalococcoidia bacterium]MCL0103112.1 PHP domain-containing protein [Dehalococcoidia bacterium]MCL0104370.1 PHP domain-containing protein [Dehalococcoidia bacterium]
MKADLHIHTCYSPDCNSSLESIIDQCQKLSIDCVAITDHDTIEGAVKMKQMAPFTVIIGEEVMSSDGEIMGYFLTEEIPSGLSAEEVVHRIKAQGGLVCLPHPFDGFGRFPLKASKREVLYSEIDIVEVFNARSLSLRYSEEALAFAQTNGFLASAGSDAHAPREIGKAYVEMPAFDGPEEFKIALSKGKIFGQKNGVKDHFLTTLGTLTKRMNLAVHRRGG